MAECADTILSKVQIVEIERPAWLAAGRSFLAASAVLHLVWETAQLPFYTLWQSGTWREIVFDVLHCSAGDVMIAALTLFFALVLFGSESWPHERARGVLLAMLAFGLVYTVYSEWLNVNVRRSWAYAPSMPMVPPLGTGLLPLLQWVFVPLVAMRIALGRPSARQPMQGSRR